MATFSDEALAHGLALDVCDQWKRENGRKTLSADDLTVVRQWMDTSRATISKFPGLRALAARGLDDLLAGKGRAAPVARHAPGN